MLFGRKIIYPHILTYLPGFFRDLYSCISGLKSSKLAEYGIINTQIIASAVRGRFVFTFFTSTDLTERRRLTNQSSSICSRDVKLSIYLNTNILFLERPVKHKKSP